MIPPTCNIALFLESRLGQIDHTVARSARKLGAILGVLGVLAGGMVAVDEPMLADHGKVAASDMTSGAPHDDIGDREAGWPDLPTLAQAETSTPSKASSWEDAIRLADPTLIVARPN
jgi:hypothetical protein